MNNKKYYPYIIALLVITTFACRGAAPDEPTLEPALVQKTATELPTTIQPTATEVPPTAEPAILIKLSKSSMVNPIALEVVQGKYKLVNGTELWTGSSISVAEDWMTFPPGLAIDVGEGGVTLMGKQYPDGTKLIVDEQGNLIER